MIEITDILDAEQHIEGLKGVIFDLDDTLYSEKEYIRSGYKAVAQRLPEVTDAESKLWFFFQQGLPAIDALLEQENIYTKELKESCLSIYRNHIPSICLYKGVMGMLKRFKDQYKLGLITDGRVEGQRAKIKELGIETLFDEIIITDDLGGTEYRKPNMKAFQIMRNKFGMEYEEMCYIGDNRLKDFQAPEQLGMKSIWFRNADGIYNKF